MRRLMLATVAVAALTAPVMAQSQGQLQTPPEATAQTKKMQSQRDWQPQQKDARPPTHQGEQKFGAEKAPGTVGQAPSASSRAIKPIPESELKPAPNDTSKTDQNERSHK